MADAVAHTGNSPGGRGSRPWRGRRAPGRTFQAKEKPNHFISVPLDHLQGFTSQISGFTDALRDASPPITGLDPSIVISPRRLHLTLGVMNLTSEDYQTAGPRVDSSRECVTPQKSITDALTLLHSLKSDIECTLKGQPLRICLNELAVMRRSPVGEADVLYIGPAATGTQTEDHTRGMEILGKLTHLTKAHKSPWRIEIVNKRFIEEGFVTDRRPLKLHCTILNTSNRKPANKNDRRRVPFSMAEIEDMIVRNPHSTGTLLSSENILEVRELNICRMGSYDELGRYVRIGGIEW